MSSALLLIALASTLPSAPKSETLSAGLIVGEPTGLTVAFTPHPRFSQHMSLGHSFGESDLVLDVDWVFRLPEIFRAAWSAPWFGLGARIATADDDGRITRLGLRAPFGISIDVEGAEAFVSVAPGMTLTQKNRVFIEATAGIRLPL